MSDDFNKDKNKEIDDFFAQFDKISDGLNKNTETDDISKATIKTDRPSSAKKAENPEISRPKRKTRSERLAETRESNKRQSILTGIADAVAAKTQSFFNILSGKAKKEFFISDEEGEDFASSENTQISGAVMTTKKKRKKKKYKLNIKKLVRFVACIGFVFILVIGIYAAVIIAKAPEINPDNIYSMLSESSVLYDADGNIIATVGSGETRTNIEFDDLPDNLVNAFVAIEDKTFWDHGGFNFIRIMGAIRDAVLSGDHISGTSTITQQLARNVYLTDTREIRSLERKISEAYYSILIEDALSKKQIIEAYLNTINLGFDSYGVQTAAQSYFSKDVNELDLIECVALASLPKSPTAFALIKKFNPEDVDPDNSVIIYTGSDYTYVYNGDKSEKRRNQTLYNMVEQGYISEEEKIAAQSEDLLAHLNPNMRSLTEISSYFSDYVISQVINDYAEENGIEYSEAREKVYNAGFQIYTTMNSDMQKIIEEEFSNNANFPKVYNLDKDAQGNILGKNGTILLYSYSNFIDEHGNFTLLPGEFEWLENGDLKIFAGNRLNIYSTTVQGATDISIEFKNMYVVEEDVFYSIQGGVILIPQQFKTRDDEKNGIISAEFFENPDYQRYIIKNADGSLTVDSDHYSLRQKVVQPQSAMVVTDYKTGHIKAMVGGRNTVGMLLYNRAVNPRQPGSSIKPVSVYGAALQQSLDILNGGSTPVFSTYDNAGNPTANSYGKYFTAASIIDDSPLMVNGRQWPKNWYTGYRGLHTLRTSVQQSVNVNAVKVIQQVGVSYAADFAEKLGITSIVREGSTNDMNPAALALGGMTKGVSPMEMASAYGTYANGGTYVEPVIYTHVANKHGETILEKVPKTEKAVDPGVSFIMTDILRSVVTEGLARAASIGSQPVAGKTGTTTDNYDAWFVGFTPQYSAAVWIGNDVNIELSQGSAAASAVWSKIMKQLCAGIPAGTFPSQPANVTALEIDTKSGLIPTELSYLDDRGTVRWEYFIAGTQPTESDNVHKYVTACSYSGYLATPYCTATYSRFGVVRPYMVDPVVADIAYEAPHYYCPIHNPDPLVYIIDPAYTGEIVPPVIPEGSENTNQFPDNGNSDGTISDGTIVDSSDGNTGDSQQVDNPNDVDADDNVNDNDQPPDWLR